jgi:hypothetical protein
MLITRENAEKILASDVEKFANGVDKYLSRTPTPNQRAAMVSLAYNIGLGAFERSSVRRKFNAGDLTGAASAFTLWVKANGRTLPGLVNRRLSEAALFKSTSESSETETPKERTTSMSSILFSLLGPMIWPILSGQLRHLLTLAGGWIMANGWIDGSSWEQVAGAIMAAAGSIWSAAHKGGQVDKDKLADKVLEKAASYKANFGPK